jgi:hypothetical protein
MPRRTTVADICFGCGESVDVMEMINLTLSAQWSIDSAYWPHKVTILHFHPACGQEYLRGWDSTYMDVTG